MRKRICLVLIGMLLLFGGCARLGERDYFAYRSKSFAGEVCGSMNGVNFCARIDLQQIGDGWAIEVSYLAPKVLADTVLLAACDNRGVMLGEIEILRGTTEFLGDGEAIAGLLRPATAWLSCANLLSVQKTGGEYRLFFEAGEMMRLRADGTPVSVSGKDFSMEMVWMERGMRD